MSTSNGPSGPDEPHELEASDGHALSDGIAPIAGLNSSGLSGADRSSSSGEALLQVRSLVKYFPITRGVVFQRNIGAVKAVDRFESALANEARRRGFDGVVCGHIHHAEMREVQGVLYINDGDWVESCTALVEHHDGRLELIDWAAANQLSFFTPRRTLLRATA